MAPAARLRAGIKGRDVDHTFTYVNFCVMPVRQSQSSGSERMTHRASDGMSRSVR